MSASTSAGNGTINKCLPGLNSGSSSSSSIPWYKQPPYNEEWHPAWQDHYGEYPPQISDDEDRKPYDIPSSSSS